MDDQNQTNQPLGQGMNPSNPNIPEDITPKDTPLSPVTPEPSSPMMAPAEPMVTNEPTDLYTTNQPAAPIPTAPIETVQTPTPAAETPFSPPADAPTVTTEMPEIPAPTPAVGEQPVQTAPTEPTLPEAKPKKKILPVVGGIVALLLVAGVAGAAYYVSNQLSTRQAVAPTAPESKPAAACSPVGDVVNQGCAALGCPAGTRRECYCQANGSYGACQCINDSSCGGGTGGGGGTACGGSGQPACGVDSTDGEANNCPTSPYTYGCGMQCCNTDVNAVCCCTGCFPAGTDCSQHTCAPAPACGDASHPIDTIEQKEIKFEKTGKVIAFMRNAGYSGTITLKKGGVVAETIPFTPTSAKELKSFNVNANDVYTISVKINSDPTESYGWITNKTDNACGPKKTPGNPLDNSKPTGKCGLDVDISDIRNTALAKTTLDSIKVNGTTTSAAVECWADALQSDATQDYDFNDFTLVFGYEKVVVTDCAPKYFCNTNSYTCQATTGTYHDPVSPASDFVSCENANTCSQNLAADAANPDTGKCYATQAACQADCVAQAVGACTEIRIYKKEETGYGLTPLTSAQLKDLTLGDVLKFVMKTNTNNLQGKFRVLVDDAVDMDWTWGNAVRETTWNEIKYEGYTVSKAGSYKFEGQVTTTP